MQLWTDYEGVTIDGAFPLKKLLVPEGRSAFFSTAGPKGEPTVVRLIECHFDEQEILARWRCVKALNHPNFLKFEHYGQIELDGGPVVYAVFEKVDANLADVLSQGHLSVKEGSELASSLVAALDVLHTHGFIHESIEPRNIFAVGDVVKLRSDCIREAPEGEEGRAAKQRDVRNLAIVLLQTLTQRQSLEGIPDAALPPPFGQIIRNGLDGTWGLENVRAALEGQFAPTPPAAAKPVKAALATAAVLPATAAVGPATAAALPPTPAVVVEQRTPAPATKPSMLPEAQLPLPLINEDPKAEYREAEFARATSRKDAWGEEQGFSRRSRWLGAIGMAVLLLLLSTWLLAHAWKTYRHNATQAADAGSQPVAQSTKAISISPAPKPVTANLPRGSHLPAAGSRSGWRVIPFTYNRKADAQKKVSSLERNHPDLQPTVFTPSGHAPYLVSIGGVMDRDAAYALARRSRSLGLPHDTYAQNYSH